MRREFMRKTDGAALGLVAVAATEARANPLGLPIGSQMYPHRALLKDFPGYVKTMADMGVTRLELCSPLGYGADFASLSNAKEMKNYFVEQTMELTRESVAALKALKV